MSSYKCNQIPTDIIKSFALFMEAFQQLDDKGRGHVSLTCHMIQFLRIWLAESANFTNVPTKLYILPSMAV